MKKPVCIILFFIMTVVMCSAFAEGENSRIIVNGVSLVMLDNDKVVKPIEKDGVLYIPFTAFLDATGISYKQQDDTYIIELPKAQSDTEHQPTPTPTAVPTPTPKPKTPYETLGSKEKMVLDKLLDYVDKFHDPSSITIIEVRNGTERWSSGYFLKLSAANKFGGKVQNWYYAGYELMNSDSGSAAMNSVEGQFDVAAMNKALKFKLEEMGY